MWPVYHPPATMIHQDMAIGTPVRIHLLAEEQDTGIHLPAEGLDTGDISQACLYQAWILWIKG